MRILGVDPGTRFCGYGVVELEGSTVSYVECGVIEAGTKAPLEQRLADVGRSIAEVIEELVPEEMAVEGIFHGIDARAALTLGHARGVVLAAAGARGLVVHAYAPSTVKKSVTGSGSADKAHVGQAVQRLLSLRRVPRSDAADALAVAICHAQHAGAARRLLRMASASAMEGKSKLTKIENRESKSAAPSSSTLPSSTQPSSGGRRRA